MRKKLIDFYHTWDIVRRSTLNNSKKKISVIGSPPYSPFFFLLLFDKRKKNPHSLFYCIYLPKLLKFKKMLVHFCTNHLYDTKSIITLCSWQIKKKGGGDDDDETFLYILIYSHRYNAIFFGVLWLSCMTGRKNLLWTSIFFYKKKISSSTAPIHKPTKLSSNLESESE